MLTARVRSSTPADMTLFRHTRIALSGFIILAPVGGALAQARPMTMAGMQMGDTSSAPLGISMERMGSGTTWIPDAVSVPARHFMAGSWELMLHGVAFAQYITQGGPRGDDQFGSLNWGMFMASRELAGGRFQARAMLSLDPATVTRGGYPLLLQSGEALDGEPLRDRQHPHDFWMELGLLYERPISDKFGVTLYAAPSGEPALGPVAFMHRPSAMDNPFAPLGHHWQDATHISFGVVTAGIFTRSWKLEGSVFNGREPNDERWDFDRIKLDSYSGRLTVNPGPAWSLSAGYGYLASPEELSPDEATHRFAAAVLHGRKLGADGQWASTLVYGMNTHHDQRSHSAAVESEAILDRWNTILARAELVQKSAEDLGLDEPPSSLAPEKTFAISSLSLGYIRELGRGRGATLGIGAMGTINLVPSSLEAAYGSRMPLGAVVFLRVRPFHAQRGMAGMHHDHGGSQR
jgi:hypothetical protein